MIDYNKIKFKIRIKYLKIINQIKFNKMVISNNINNCLLIILILKISINKVLVSLMN